MDEFYKPGTKRQRIELLRSQLDTERTTFIPHYQELNSVFAPRRARFLVSDVNKGDRRNRQIINNIGPRAARILSSGMMSGVTSPARPWMKVTTTSKDLNKLQPVKEWCDDVTQTILDTFQRSNLYNSLPLVYKDLGVYGTAALHAMESFDDDIVTFEVYPVGSYFIANNFRQAINTVLREFTMTVDQIVDEFGRDKADPRDEAIDWTNISLHVQRLYKEGQIKERMEIVHLVYPNPRFDPSKIQSKYKRFASCYYERGITGKGKESSFYLQNDDQEKMLRESGFDDFPMFVPRWEVTGEDAYANDCPGMLALGDNNQLQTGEKRLAQAIEKLVNPPMVGPPEMEGTSASIIAGHISYVAERDGTKGFRPAHEVDPRVNELKDLQVAVSERIKDAFYVNLFLMLAESDRREITAREIEERHEEKLLALSPVLEQLDQDLLDPLVKWTFKTLLKRGLLPPPPEELRNVELKIEYVSIMAQAQKQVGIGQVERFIAFLADIAQKTGDMTILDKLDIDELIERYADMSGVPPAILRQAEEVAAIRAERNKSTQTQMMAEMVAKGAGAARDLSQASLEGDTALTRLSRAGQLTQQVA